MYNILLSNRLKMVNSFQFGNRNYVHRPVLKKWSMSRLKYIYNYVYMYVCMKEYIIWKKSLLVPSYSNIFEALLKYCQFGIFLPVRFPRVFFFLSPFADDLPTVLKRVSLEIWEARKGNRISEGLFCGLEN